MATMPQYDLTQEVCPKVLQVRLSTWIRHNVRERGSVVADLSGLEPRNAYVLKTSK